MQEAMTIGRLAKVAGVNVETIRYYQRRGLIGEPHKPPGGHRRYPILVLARLNFIRRAQQLGFSLAEVKTLLDHADGKSPRETRRLAERKRDSLRVHVEHLQKMLAQLESLIDASKKVKGKGPDPIVDALNTSD